MSECLARVLPPFDTRYFLRHYQSREHFHIARALPGFYEDLLSESDLDALLESEHLPAAFVNVVKEGKKYPLEEWSRVATGARSECRVAIPDRLFDFYLQGATLILNGANQVISSLNNFSRTLTQDLGFPVHVNVYITPIGAAGFSKHEDDHEVLILQIVGSKQWQLYPDDAPAVEINLQCGDLLYLPRGLHHAAKAQESDSIHATLGLKPVYAFQLIEELATLAERDPAFQQPAPPQFADHAAKRTFEVAFLKQLHSLVLRAKPADLLERRFHSLVEKQAIGWSGRLSDLRILHAMTMQTIICRRPGILTLVKREGKFLHVGFGGKCVKIPAFLEGALGKIFAGNEFAIGEIEGFIGGAGKVKLVTEFVRAGLLRIVKI